MAPKWLKVPQKSIFSGLRPNPTRALPLDPIGGGRGGGGLQRPPPPQTPQLSVTSYARLQPTARVA